MKTTFDSMLMDCNLSYLSKDESLLINGGGEPVSAIPPNFSIGIVDGIEWSDGFCSVHYSNGVSDIIFFDSGEVMKGIPDAPSSSPLQ